MNGCVVCALIPAVLDGSVPVQTVHRSGLLAARDPARAHVDFSLFSQAASVLEGMLGVLRPFSGRATLTRCIVGLSVACAPPSTFAEQRTAGAAGAGASGAIGGGGSAGATQLLAAGGGPDPAIADPLGTANLFSELLHVSEDEVNAKTTLAVQRIFGIGTGEPNRLLRDRGYRLYYELPQDPSLAFIWAPDSDDVRSEGMSYGMMIAVQMNLQAQYDRLWKFAQTFMQVPETSPTSSWRHYFRWQGRVDASNPDRWLVNYAPETGPAPDGDQYFAAALYLAHRRWGSAGAVNYQQEADALTSALLHNPALELRCPIFRQDNDMVVFFPEDASAEFSDPSYHLPAFYRLFAAEAPVAEDRARWLHIAEISRQYLVDSAHPVTGLHPDYANFDGSPNDGGADHDQFGYDAWRVVMNMAIDGAWGGVDERLQAQVEKYHAFFANRLTDDGVQRSLFSLDGSFVSGSGSTALTATLASGALISRADNRARYVQNLWNAPQQTGTFRYYQETVYMLGLLSTGGHYAQRWQQ
jgi:oligosaccharide reducing-end xylanase